MNGRALVALATCSAFPDGAPDDRSLVAPLGTHGIDAEPAVWDDPGVDWSRYDLVVLRSTWDYPSRRAHFLAWCAAVPRLANPIAAVQWSSDKRYLTDLAAAGVPSVTSWYVEPGAGDLGAVVIDEASRQHAGFVVKPTVGAGSVDVGRYASGDPDALGAAHVRALVADGRTALVQPYLDSVDRAGETSLMFFGGVFSHAIRKGALLTGPVEDVDGLFKDETIDAVEPIDEQVELGAATLAAAAATVGVGVGALTYARIDVLDAESGAPTVLECELVEPSLFLGESVGAADRLASTIAGALS